MCRRKGVNSETSIIRAKAGFESPSQFKSTYNNLDKLAAKRVLDRLLAIKSTPTADGSITVVPIESREL